MSLNTVAEFAKELHKSPQDLLEQLHAAGVAKKSASVPGSLDFLRVPRG